MDRKGYWISHAVALTAVASIAVCGGAAVAGEHELGAKVYEEQRCRLCHSIAGEGNKRNPLDGVGSRLDEAAIRKWIVAPAEMDPKVKKKAYDSLAAEQLDALVRYMQSLKAAD